MDLISTPVGVFESQIPAPPQIDRLPPTATKRPEVTGDARAGRWLVASPGRWTAAARYEFAWSRCNAIGTACEPIAGADGARYKATSRDSGRRLRVDVTASSAAGTAATAPSLTRVIRAAQGITAINGTEGDDRLSGTDGPDRIRARGGHDTLLGGPGADQLFGGAGRDLLDGGSGADELDGGAGIDRVAHPKGDRAVRVERP